MKQLVGQLCTHCRQRISSDFDARFCEACGCPVHAPCVRAAASRAEADVCPSCHTPAAVLHDLAGPRQAVLDGLAAERQSAAAPRPGKVWAGGACPKCKLINPPSAQRCDCGYDFVTGSVERSYLSARGGGRPDTASRLVGGVCLVLGPLLLVGGVVAVGGGGNPGPGTAEGSGMLCGSLCPGVAVLALAAYLFRRGR